MHYIDMAIAFAIFIFFFTYVLFLAINYFTVQPHAARIAEYRQKAIDFFESVFESEGEPENWEKTGAPAKLGVASNLYRIPVVVKETSGYDRTNELIALNLTLDEDCTDKAWNDTIRIYDENMNEIPSEVSDQVFCVNQYLKQGNIIFEANVSASQSKKYFIYYSGFEDVNPPNYSKFHIVGYWKFDEGSGTIAHDETGNDNDGILYNGTVSCADIDYCPKWVDGKFGKAIEFDGVDDYIKIPDDASLNPISDSITVSVWVKPNFLGVRQIIEAYGYGGVPNAEPYWMRLDANNKFQFIVSNGTPTDVYSTTTATAGQWYYVVGRYNGSHVSIFVNGVEENSTSLTGNMVDSNTDLYIGQNTANNYFFNGTIDDVRIYDRALTSEEIIILNNSAPLEVKHFPEESIEALSPDKLNVLKTLVYEKLRKDIGEEYKFRIEITQ
jgi:hypothetical protein